MIDDTKKCPFCAEIIKSEAIVCRYCKRDLPKPVVVQTPPQVSNPKAKSSSLRNLLIVLIAGVVIVCCGLLSLAGIIDADSPSVSVSTNTPSFETETPSGITDANLAKYDGVTFSIIKIEREQTTQDPSNQTVMIGILLQSGNVKFAGFDVKASELIIDSDLGGRQSAKSVSPECIVRDDEMCETEALFELPINESSIRLYYVSDNRMDDKEPIDVIEEGERHFIAEIDLQSAYLKPTATPTATIDPLSTATNTPTVTPTKTPVPTSTPNVGSEVEAEVWCRQFVRDNLLSPSSANFGGFFEDWDTAVFIDKETAESLEITGIVGPGVWVVSGQVEAQNAFGATIRNDYICALEYRSSTDRWYLLDILIE